MAVNLKTVYVRNFEMIREASLAFPKAGLGLVLGPIGAGKTALGEAVSRTLLGVHGRYRGAGLGAYSCDHLGNKDTVVCLEADLDGKPLTIWSGYKTKEFDLDPRGESLRFKHGDTTIERGDFRETRSELNQLLGVPSNLAEYTIHADGKKLNFEDLSETQLVDLFLTSLSTGNWEQAQQRVKQTLEQTLVDQRAAEASAATITGMVRSTQDFIDESKAKLPELEAEISEKKRLREQRILDTTAEAQAIQNKIRVFRLRQVEIKAELKKLEEESSKLMADYELQLSRARSDVVAHNPVLATTNSVLGGAKRTLGQAKSFVADLQEPTNCPTCGKPWDKKHSDKALQEATDNVVKASKILARSEQELEHASVEHAKLEGVVSSWHAKIRKCGASRTTTELSEEYERTESVLEAVNEDLIATERKLAKFSSPVDESSIILVRQQIRDAEQRLTSMTTDIAKNAAQQLEISTTVAILRYWHKAFGPTGLPNMILNDSLGYMNHVSANISTVLTGGMLRVSYAATKILASEEQRPELVIHVQNDHGAKRFLGSSKGEAGVSNLIVCETLHEIGRLSQRVNYRWLDEAVNSQDKRVRDSVYSYLRGQCREKNMLAFAVDHHQDVEAHADFGILAEKGGDGFTQYRFT